MATSTYKIPIELSNIGEYTPEELKSKLMAYAMMIVSVPKGSAVASVSSEHTDWVKKMAKYRILDAKDDKEMLLEALDERYK